MASQKRKKSWATPWGFRLIMEHIPLKAESFSSLSLMFRSERHHTRTNWFRYGATSFGHASPSRPIVMAVFSSSVLGVVSRLMFCISFSNISGRYCFMSAPSWIDTSPMDQVALLHTDTNSGLRFWLRSRINSPEKQVTGMYEWEGREACHINFNAEAWIMD